MKKVKVLSVNISKEKGTIKNPVPSITLTENGVEGDAHSGPWNRQVSLLGIESIRKFEKEANRKINFGEFAENITTEGLELWKCHLLDRFVGKEIELEVTQIGKECHGTSCAIFKEAGNCVMPKEGIFARVLRPGTISTQSPVIAKSEAMKQTPTELTYVPKIFSSHIITLSDRAFRGDYEDKSGPRVKELLENQFGSWQLAVGSSQLAVGSMQLAVGSVQDSSFAPRLSSVLSLLPDDPDQLRNTLKESIDAGTDFIFTTGGTGIGLRDFTPDVVKPMLDKEIPGIMEMIRVKYGTQKYQALLSRSIAGVSGNSLIFTLPGSVKAVNEYMEEITKSLMHMVYMLHGLDAH